MASSSNNGSDGNGQVIFTGPSCLRDHRVSVEEENRAIGIGSLSREVSSEINYVWRAAPGTPFPKPKAAAVGEIGWGIPWFTDWIPPQTGEQIMLGVFRQTLEDHYSHRNQNPKEHTFKKTNLRSPEINPSTVCSKKHDFSSVNAGT